MTGRLELGREETAERRGGNRRRARRETEAFEDGPDGLGRLDRRQDTHELPATGTSGPIPFPVAGAPAGRAAVWVRTSNTCN